MYKIHLYLYRPNIQPYNRLPPEHHTTTHYQQTMHTSTQLNKIVHSLLAVNLSLQHRQQTHKPATQNTHTLHSPKTPTQRLSNEPTNYRNNKVFRDYVPYGKLLVILFYNSNATNYNTNLTKWYPNSGWRAPGTEAAKLGQ